MNAKRYSIQPSILCTARANLDPALHPSIDAVLKDLKACTRNLQAALASQRDELQILERLYYKGKNQHRSALFWKRADETRRYGLRLKEMQLGNTIELLRYSFFGDSVIRNPKALRGSWTHCPDAKYLRFILNRISAGYALVCKMRERLDEAYRYFTISMQSGYFIQLVLTLAAVTSRMSVLASDIREVLEQASSVCHRILQILDPVATAKMRPINGRLSRPTEDPINPQSTRGSRAATIALKESATEPGEDEDIGTSIERPSIESLAPPVEPSSAGTSHETTRTSGYSDLLSLNSTSVNLSAPQSQSTVKSDSTAVKEAAITIKSKKREDAERSAEASTIVVKKRKNAEDKLSLKKKSKKKRDEIDDIFGF